MTESATLPSAFLIFRYGTFPSGDSTVVFDRGVAEACVRNAHNQVPIVRSTTLGVAWSDCGSPALGWARLEARDDGLYAAPAEWIARTPDEAQAVLSLYPVCAIRMETRERVTGEPVGARVYEIFLTDEPAERGGLKVSAQLKDADWLEGHSKEARAQIDSCGWGKAIEDAHCLRAEPALPEGWSRVFESHWSCGPYYLYYPPGRSHDGRDDLNHPHEASVSVCAFGVTFGFACHEDPIAIARIVTLAAIDGAWLKAWEAAHSEHECGKPWLPGPKPEGYLSVAPWWVAERLPCLQPLDSEARTAEEREATRLDAEACLAEHPGSIVVVPPFTPAKAEVVEFLDAIENLLPEGPRPASFAVYVARANRPLLRLQVTEVHRT